MTSKDATPGSSPPPAPPSPSDPSPHTITFPKVRSPERAASAARPLSDFTKRRSNNALSQFFASSSAAAKRASSPLVGIPQRRSSSAAARGSSPTPDGRLMFEERNEYRSLIMRSFAPSIAVLPSHDTEEFLAQKGLPNGLLSLLRPYGENVAGRVTIRDSAGSSKSCDDYAVHFSRLKDGLESPRIAADAQASSDPPRLQNISSFLDAQNPRTAARTRTGGDVALIEDALHKRLLYSDLLGHEQADRRPSVSAATSAPRPSRDSSAFHLLYTWRILSGLPAVPYETFSHPVACVIAASARSADPIEDLRHLNASTRTGNDRLPPWMNNDYLRYFVLLHDEEHDDSTRSQALFEQMKRHFGLHVHLLRLRSTQCVPSDDGCVTLPLCEWQSASEELSEINWRETLDELDAETGPYLFDSDAAAVRAFVRELVTQSVVPHMERNAAMWNDQIVSRRRGLSGRFFSLSRKWTAPFGAAAGRRFSAFGTSSPTTDSPSPTTQAANSNYDPTSDSYAPETPEALMRKLGDYAFMLRDFKLAFATFDLLRGDHANDKATSHTASASEMTALASLLTPLASKPRPTDRESIDALLETAVSGYTARNQPFAALRLLVVASELLHIRAATAASSPHKPTAASAGPLADASARTAALALTLNLLPPIGAALTSEHIASNYAHLRGAGSGAWGARKRKALLWRATAAQAWLSVGQARLAELSVSEALRLAGLSPLGALGSGGSVVAFAGMRRALESLSSGVAGVIAREMGADDFGVDEMGGPGEVVETELGDAGEAFPTLVPAQGIGRKMSAASGESGRAGELRVDISNEKPDIRRHRRSMSRIAVPVPTERETGEGDGDRE